MTEGGRTLSDIRAMLHHAMVVVQRNEVYEWSAVYDYEQRKRKSVQEHDGNYAVLEWHLPEEEARLNQLLLRQSWKHPKRERVDLAPDADGKRRCLDFWTGQKICKRTN